MRCRRTRVSSWSVSRQRPLRCSTRQAYHPIWFSSAKSLRLDNPLQRTLLHCAARGIAIYSPHTALDSCAGGIDDWLAEGLEPRSKRQRIQPMANPPSDHPSAGLGMQVSLSSPATLDELVQRIKSHLSLRTGPSTHRLALGVFDAPSHARPISARSRRDQDGRVVCR